MNRQAEANAAPPPPAPAPDTSSEESDDRAAADRGDTGTDEEHVRDVDPHPDTADDFDEDASAPRESIESIRHDTARDDDD